MDVVLHMLDNMRDYLGLVQIMNQDNADTTV